MNTKTITLTNGQTIHTSVKSGRMTINTPLLVMNGIGASLSLLSPFVDALHKSNPDIEIITFDCPGVGGSSTPCLPYRFSGLAEVVAEMLDVLNYDKVDVLGLSWGGFAATQFAYDFPERVGKLILAATATGVTSIPPSLKVLSLMASPRRYTDPEYMASIAPDLYGGKFRTNPTLALEYAEKMSKNKDENKGSGLGYKYQQLAICWWSSVWMLPSIKQPTLLLAGDDDPLIDIRNMKMMDKLLPNSELHTITDGGHLFLITDLDIVIPIINKFLEGIE